MIQALQRLNATQDNRQVNVLQQQQVLQQDNRSVQASQTNVLAQDNRRLRVNQNLTLNQLNQLLLHQRNTMNMTQNMQTFCNSSWLSAVPLHKAKGPWTATMTKMAAAGEDDASADEWEDN